MKALSLAGRLISTCATYSTGLCTEKNSCFEKIEDAILTLVEEDASS